LISQKKRVQSPLPDRIVVDRVVMEENITKACDKCGGVMTFSKWKVKGKGPSPSMQLCCSKCRRLFFIINLKSIRDHTIETSAKYNKFITLTNYLLLVTILLSGDTLCKAMIIFCKWNQIILLIYSALLGINIGSPSYYHRHVVPDMDKATYHVLTKFLIDCRLKTPDKNNVK
jgi:hypothetical protein